MSSFDVFAAVQELSDQLVGARIDKAYQPTREEVLLRVRVDTEKAGDEGPKRDLVIGPGRYVYITRVPRDNPQSPSQFAMMLRKNVGNGRILAVRQHGFDRVIEIDIGKREGMYTLIVELFHDGNIILVQHGRILACLFHQSWATRQVRPGRDLEYAPSGPDLHTMNFDQFAATFRESDADVVRTLATGIGIGPLWGEEVALRASVPKNQKVADTSASEVSALWESLRGLFERVERMDLEPVLVKASDGEDAEKLDATPFELRVQEGRFRERKPTFQHALDAYFSKHVEVSQAPREDPRVRKVRDIREKFERQVAQMEGAMGKFEKDEADAREKGDLAYAHFDTVAKTLDAIVKASREKGWAEVQNRLKEARKAKSPDVAHIESVIPAEGIVTLALPDSEGKTVRLRLDVRKNVQENAEKYYARAKKMKDKRAGAVKALVDAKKRLESVSAEGVELLEKLTADAKKAPATRQFWFEAYRWFRTSDGLIVVAGRDAGGNEKVVKKQLSDSDRYVHANVSGAPSCVVKAAGGEPPESSLEEACQFAVAMSKAWNAGYGASEAYWVLPAQVSKSAEAGEYVGKGAFVIRGKRNYVTCPVLAAIGEVEIDGHRKVMGGPVSAVQAQAKRYVIFAPGDTSKNVIANRLAERFHVPVQEIQTAMPPGDVRVIEAKGLEL